MKFTENLHFSLAYRYANPLWTQGENDHIYGSDSSLKGLGGDFVVSIVVEIEPKLWQPSCLAPLKAQFDHRCLFEDVPYFVNTSSTLENVTTYMACELLRIPIDGGKWVSLQVQESQNLAAQYLFAEDQLVMKVRHGFPMQWQTPQGWGGGKWEAWVALQRPVDGRTGLMFSRQTLQVELYSITKTHSARVGQIVDDLAPLVGGVAQDFAQLKGFKTLEISVESNKTFHFYG